MGWSIPLQVKGNKMSGPEVEVGVVWILDIIAYHSNRGCQCREIMGECREPSELQITDLQGKEQDRDKDRGTV